MVKRFVFVLFFLWASAQTVGALEEPTLSASINSDQAIEKRALIGSIEITHDEKEKIDEESFLLKGKPLKVELEKRVKISPDSGLTVSIYRFALPEQTKGLQILPEITVLIGGKKYKSIPSTYEVQGETPTLSKKAELKLRAAIRAPSPLYPGQKVLFVYTYYYAGSIELTKEELPLLEAKGFFKIGALQIKETTEGEINIREALQEAEARKPGTYSFGRSLVEGKAYEESGGKKRYSAETLHAEYPPVSLTVEPFPAQDRPASFQGAMGNFTEARASLTTGSSLRVGDKGELIFEIYGETSDWDSVYPPNICCQPGFSGLFRLGDLPPVAQVGEGKKSFLFEIYPLSSRVKEIPSIEYGFFDPEEKIYKTLKSASLPLSVLPALEKEEPKEERKEKAVAYAAPAIEAIGPPYLLTTSDLENLFFASWQNLWLLPAGAAFLYWQRVLRREQSLQAPTLPNGEQLFRQALAQKENPLFFHLLEEAFLQRLAEKGIVSKDAPLESLPQSGAAGEARAFLLRLEEKRFTGQAFPFDASAEREAQEIFQKIN